MKVFVMVMLALLCIAQGVALLLLGHPATVQPQCREGHWEHVKRDHDVWVCDVRDAPAGQKLRESNVSDDTSYRRPRRRVWDRR